MLSERYRIVALIGSGGMGEVYRAEDIKLGQQVALKFLPRTVAADARGVQRLYDEVRLGRQVSHPNVCRLYDIAEWEGVPFLAMEYVDGEDLASLLRRIGKLPGDKALDIARDICAGIAAAHGLGIIHRDLKPANVMIDGRGTARITDFGLAAVAEELHERREFAGTPLYMAPEQLRGAPATQKTDLYALGLILYEMFTGRRLFDPATAADLTSRRASTKSQSLSSETRDIDPAVQRVILRCLEEEAQARPTSIHAVIAALPSGDPLQAALEAGETPSPQMVAAAGTVGDLKPAVAWSLLAASIAGLAAASVLIEHTMLFHLVPLPKPPEVLIERAETIVQNAGYTDSPVESHDFFDFDSDFFQHALEKNQAARDWSWITKARPGAFHFLYRQAQRRFIPHNDENSVWPDDPPSTIPGMIDVSLDPLGRLISFNAVPLQRTTPGPIPKVDWSQVLAEAGGDFEKLRPVVPQWSAPVDSDEKVAWEGFFRGDRTPIRIEGASYRGRMVHFEVIGPWRQPVNPKDANDMPATILNSIPVMINVIAILVGVPLALRNMRQGRGDRAGARRLGVFVFASAFAGALVRTDHVANVPIEWDLIKGSLGRSLYIAAFAWILYLALEPYVRRRWPYTLVSWRRLLAGRFRDPMVGRDLLFGFVGGTAIFILRLLTVHAPTWLGKPPLLPISSWVSPLNAGRHLLYAWMSSQVQALFVSMFNLFLLFFLLAVFRRRAAAVAGVWCFLAVMINLGDQPEAAEFVFGAVMAGIAVFLLTRFGLLAFAAAAFVDMTLTAAPITLDTSAWYFGRSAAVLIALFAIAAYGFYVSLGNKPLLSVPILEE